MLHKVDQDSDWKSKYQQALEALDEREREFCEIEALLRKTVGRLSIAGRGLDARLDEQLSIIQRLTREKRDDKLRMALDELSAVIASLDDPEPGDKNRRSDPLMVMLELLQNIHFSASQRGELREICAELLKSVARGQDRDSISVYVQRLATLINQNFDQVDANSNTAEVVLRLLDLLHLDDSSDQQIRERFGEISELHDAELRQLADLLNARIHPAEGGASIDKVMTTLLERLAIIQGAGSDTQEIQARLHAGQYEAEWPETLNEIVNSISDSLKKLDQERRELEGFIVHVTEQLGEITEVIAEDHRDHQSDHADAQSLHDFVQEGMSLMQKNFQSSTDLQELKSAISANIETIRGGVDNFVERFNQRHEATEERNLRLAEQLSQMEQETQELQVMLMENRAKLLYDALTGVYSRMAYDDRIVQEISRWNRYGTPFSYVILDIDHFKRINDSYGHNAGDKALKIVAQLMQQYVRKSDYVFRIGGEEFVLLLCNTSAADADTMVQKMRQGIADSSFHFKGEPVTVTLSAGITEARPNDDVESIYERADQALYKAKHAGRNRQFIAS